MSYNRLTYDTCAYTKDVNQSVSVLDYNIFKPKFVFNKCTTAGTDSEPMANEVSFIDRTITENELYGIVRKNSLCPSEKFNPNTVFKPPEFSPNSVCEGIHRMTPTNLVKPVSNMLNNPDLGMS